MPIVGLSYSSFSQINLSKNLTKIINCHRLDPNNIGDISSRPSNYFPLGENNADILDRSIKQQISCVSSLILGGGGLLWGNIDETFHELIRIAQGPVVVWGVGLNHKNMKEEDKWPHWLAEADLVGVRDIGSNYTWVPCASCMSSLFDKEYPATNPIVFYLHHNLSKNWGRELEHARQPVMYNNVKTMSEAINFIASGQVVVTTSYHGAYWATLLGRKVVVAAPQHSRFYFLKHPPVLSGIKDWQKATDKAVAYPEALAECRAANVAFYDKVVTLLANID
jgi:hypothetical protein